MSKTYKFRSNRELTYSDTSRLAEGLQCPVSFIGEAEVKGEKRWEYVIEKEDLKKEDIELVKEKGLTLLLT